VYTFDRVAFGRPTVSRIRERLAQNLDAFG
jgi:hypothetical protein